MGQPGTLRLVMDDRGMLAGLLLAGFASFSAISANAVSVRHSIACVRRFIEERHLQSPNEITPAAIQGHIASLTAQGLAPRTVRNHHVALSRFCRFLRARGHLAVDPCLETPLPRPTEALPNYLTEEEAWECLQLAGQHGIHCEVCLALNTGLRMSELRRLEGADVDMNRRCLVVRMSKGRRPRSVPLNSAAVGALRSQRARFGHLPHLFPGGRLCAGKLDPGGTWTRCQPRGLDWWAREALKPLQAAIPKFQAVPKGNVGRGWHLFRHTFATRLVQAGVSIYKVSRWLGHRNLRTTEMYAHLASGYDVEIEQA